MQLIDGQILYGRGIEYENSFNTNRSLVRNKVYRVRDGSNNTTVSIECNNDVSELWYNISNKNEALHWSNFYSVTPLEVEFRISNEGN